MISNWRLCCTRIFASLGFVWLEYSDNDDVEAIFARKQRRIKNKVITLLEKELETDETSSSRENVPDEDGKDDFFDSLFVDKATSVVAKGCQENCCIIRG